LIHPERVGVEGIRNSRGEAAEIAPASGEIAVRTYEGDKFEFARWIVGPVERVLGSLDIRNRPDLIQSIRERVA